MRFQDFPYRRPDIRVIENEFSNLIRNFEQATEVEEQHALMTAIHNLRREYESMSSIAYVRHTIDTTDPYYREEQDYIDETGPLYQGLVSRYYKTLTESKFKEELERRWGKQLFRIAENAQRTFSPEIVEDLQLENKLTSEFTRLTASARIPFEGEDRSLAQLAPFAQSQDRTTRKKAAEARTAFFVEHEAELDELFDRLVKLRTKIAHKLGYNNFVELGYARMNRTDYGPAEVAKFREQVRSTVVPITMKLKERQRERIGVDRLRYYDDTFSFESGNANPKGDPEQIVANAKRMYEEMSEETGAFFRRMVDEGLMDLLSKPGKAGGGYCAMIAKQEAPFIFANFNGTSSDIDVLTHEAGHALQSLCSLKYNVPEYEFPTAEACEIHSMSMEFFAWPWMELFFGEEAEKYKFKHMTDSLLFLPTGSAFDEFQHYVYENPEATPEERKRAWRDIEKMYTPYRDYEENDFLERGGLWLQNGHVFCIPFYYIDYALARVCSFQLWKRASENTEAAWYDYMNLCEAGGSRSFLELLALGHLDSPFADGCVEGAVEEIERWLNRIDDRQM